MKRLLLAAGALVFVLAACGGSQRVPKGVSEVDIRAPVRVTKNPNPPDIFSRRITDPSQVKRIIGWFDSLQRLGNNNTFCAGGLAADVTFTFRSANGVDLAKAYSPPSVADTCDPIHFTTRGRQETFLVDGNQATPLIGRVRSLLGPRFRPTFGYLG
jgi:hypothetical protein